MELEATSGEIAVDDPLLVGDVRAVSRRPVLREVVVVRVQLAEHRERARGRQILSQRTDLLQRDLHVNPPPRRQHAREVHGTCDLVAVQGGS